MAFGKVDETQHRASLLPLEEEQPALTQKHRAIRREGREKTACLAGMNRRYFVDILSGERHISPGRR